MSALVLEWLRNSFCRVWQWAHLATHHSNDMGDLIFKEPEMRKGDARPGASIFLTLNSISSDPLGPLSFFSSLPYATHDRTLLCVFNVYDAPTERAIPVGSVA